MASFRWYGYSDIHFPALVLNPFICYQIPTLASCSFDEIVDAAQPSQPLFLQLYVVSILP